MITQAEIRRLFYYNKKTGILRWKIKPSKHSNIKIGDEAGSIGSNGYKRVQVNNKHYYVHIIIWIGMTGYKSENDIDHKDRNRINNKWNNLREISKQCNQRNCSIRKDNTSGIKGVSFCKRDNKWLSRLAINKKQKTIGAFKDFDEAVCHRLAVEQCLDWNKCDLNSSAYKYVKENIQ